MLHAGYTDVAAMPLAPGTAAVVFENATCSVPAIVPGVLIEWGGSNTAQPLVVNILTYCTDQHTL